MTYCAAFITEHAIYLTADSAVSTLSARPDHEETFFGEITEQEGFSINDDALKIFPLDENRVVAAAGISDCIQSAINFLLEHGSDIKDTRDLFSSLNISLSLNKGCVNLICVEKQDGKLTTGVWSAGEDYRVTPSHDDHGRQTKAVNIGTGGKEYGYITESAADMVRKYPLSKIQHSLVLVSSYHQLAGCHTTFPKDYVGGAFITIAMTLDGLIWQPDISYYLYFPSEMRAKEQEKKKLQSFLPVNVLIRESIVFVERRVPEYRSLMMTGGALPDKVEHVRKTYQDEVGKIAKEMGCKHAVFLSRESHYAVYLYRFDPDYCIRHSINDNYATTTYAEDFYKLLLSEPEHGEQQGAALIEVVPRGLLSEQH